MQNEVDQKLKNRYERAYAIISGLGGSVELIIEVANQIRIEEERQYKASNKSDFGSISDVETEKEKMQALKKEKEEEEAWGELDLGMPKEEKKKDEV